MRWQINQKNVDTGKEKKLFETNSLKYAIEYTDKFNLFYLGCNVFVFYFDKIKGKKQCKKEEIQWEKMRNDEKRNSGSY